MPTIIKPRTWCVAMPLANRGWRIESDESWIPKPPSEYEQILRVRPAFYKIYVGIPFAGAAECVGGVAPFTWTAIPANQLPIGITFSTSGVLSGTVSDKTYQYDVDGVVTFYPTFEVTDSSERKVKAYMNNYIDVIIPLPA